MDVIFYISSLLATRIPLTQFSQPSNTKKKKKNPIHAPPVGIKHYANTVIQ